MKNILFTPPHDQKVLDETKTFTARFWHDNYPLPEPGEIVTASTGRKKETRFAKLKIIQVTQWKPGEDDSLMLMVRTGYTAQQLAEKEGFKDFPEFFNTYAVINDHHDPHDPNRKHYFIEFELIEAL